MERRIHWTSRRKRRCLAICDELGMTGTKFGCGIAQCGACTVHVGEAMRSCSVQVGDMANKTITTIEGLSPDARHLGAAGLARRGRAAMRLLSVRADHGRGRFLKQYLKPTDADIDANLNNICRCGTYVRIRRAFIARGTDDVRGGRTMNQIINTSISRRCFVVSSASLAGGLAITVALPGFADAASIAAQYGTDVPTNEINAFLPFRRTGGVLIRSPHNEMGGRHHRAADDRRRGARMRLVEGEGRICLGRAQSARKGSLRPDGYRRQPRRARFLANAAAGRRQRARTPHRGRGTAMERAGFRMRGGKQQGHPQEHGPQPGVRRLAGDAGRIKLDKEPAIRTPDQFARSASRSPASTPAQGQRRGQVCDRHAGPGHGVRGGGYLSGVRRQAQKRR